MIASILAATLSLTSTNDYRYVKFPTNQTISVEGFGVGTTGDSLVPRREDWCFLDEAFRERTMVSYWMSDDANTNSLAVKDHECEVSSTLFPKYFMAGTLINHSPWMNSTNWNAATPICSEPTNRITTATMCPGAEYDRSQYRYVVDPSVARAAMVDGLFPVSTRLWTCNATSIVETVYDSPRELALGVLTNAYIDLAKNDRVIFTQPVRCGNVPVNQRIASEYTYANDAYGYNWPTSEFIKRRDSRSDNTYGSGTPYRSRIYLYRTMVNVDKSAYAACSNQTVYATGTGSSRVITEVLETEREPSKILFSNPLGTADAEILSFDAAYALLLLEHWVRQGESLAPTNRSVEVDVTNRVTAIIAPVDISLDGDLHDGLTSASVRIRPDVFYSVAAAAADEHIWGPSRLSGLIDVPPQPSPDPETKIGRHFIKSRTFASEEFSVTCDCIVGFAKMKFHARVVDDE